MRATLRITWFLFSLSLLFDSICPDDTQTDTSGAQKTATAIPVIIPSKPSLLSPVSTTVKTDVTVNNVPTNYGSATHETANASSAAATSVSTNQNAVTTQKTTNLLDPQPTAPTTGPVTAAAATTKPTQTSMVPINPPPTPARPTAGVYSVMVYVTNGTSEAPTVPNTTPPSKTSSSDSTGLPTRPGTVKIPEPGVTTKIPEVSTMAPADPSNSGAPVTTKGTTNSQTTVQGGGTPTMSPADNKGGTKDTLTISQEPTPFKTTVPATTSGLNSQTQQPGTIDTTVRTSPPQTTTIITTTSTTTSASPKKFIYSLLSEQETKEEEDLAKVCRLLMPNWLNGTCTLTWRHHNGKVQFDLVEIDGKVKTSQAAQYYEEITKKPTDNRTLIAILASCGALLIMIVILAVCASHHRKPYHENQQHLTEELHTVENGYHDNPTLEVMEVQPEMQEKKMALNGEFNDSWIVPIDNLLKEDLPDEEDTHL